MTQYSKIETLNTLSERVISLLSKNGYENADSFLDARDVKRHIRDIANSLILGEWRSAYKDGEKTVDAHYLATFDLNVEWDSRLKRCFSRLPGTYVAIYNHKGIQMVRPYKSDGTLDIGMVIIQPFEMEIYGGLQASALEGRWSLEPDRGQLIFHKKFGRKTLKEAGINKVQVQMISVDPASVGDDDSFPVPPEMYAQIITETMKVFGFAEQQVADAVVDGNPNVKTR